MYKTKFAQWGVQKYLKSADVLAILRQELDRDAVNKLSEFIVRGRKIHINAVKRHLSRNPGLLNTVIAKNATVNDQDRDIVCLTPPPEGNPVAESKVNGTQESKSIFWVANQDCLRCRLLGLIVST